MLAAMKQRPYLIFLSNTTGYRVGNIVHGILAECHRRKVGLLWREFEHFNLRTLSHPPVGLIVWGKREHIDHLIAGVKGRYPIVSTISHTLEHRVFTVVPDPVQIARRAADHLVGEGLRHFIFVGSRRNPAAQMRYAAFQATLARQGVPGPCTFFDVDLTDRFWGADAERGHAFVKLLRRAPRPVGVFAFNDQTAASCLECAELADVRVPQDMAIVGVDDHPIFSRMYLPLTTIKVDYTEIGRRAVDLLLRAEGPKIRGTVPLHHFVDGELVVRESSCLRLLSDPRLSKALRYLHNHLAEPLTLPQLARQAGMSRASFAQHFRGAAGEAPIRYLVHQRLARARLLLAESPLTVAEIAHRVGFEDQGYFTRSFKRLHRITPSAYRQKHLRQRLHSP